ncbi:MAG: 30S ribosomal protein S20 [Candidatus Binatia bacterium]
MANHPSALKRHRQSERKRIANRATRSKIGTSVGKVAAAIAAGDADTANRELKSASVTLAKAASKGVIHRSTASRRISRLARQVARLSG